MPTATDNFTGRQEYGFGHTYFIDGRKVTGVTTAIGSGYPKNLAKWGCETTANFAIDNWQRLGRLTVSARLRELTGAPWADRDRAAVRGTNVHTLAEKVMRGEQVTVPADVAGYVTSCQKFLSDWDVKPVHIELPVFSRKHSYGGTADLIAKLTDGQTWLLDWKTNRSGPFGDVAFQLSAYRYADFYIGNSDGEQPVNELSIPDVDACGVVWLQEDGYQFYPYTSDRSVFKQFLSIMDVARSVEDTRGYKGMALAKPVRLGDR